MSKVKPVAYTLFGFESRTELVLDPMSQLTQRHNPGGNADLTLALVATLAPAWQNNFDVYQGAYLRANPRAKQTETESDPFHSCAPRTPLM